LGVDVGVGVGWREPAEAFCLMVSRAGSPVLVSGAEKPRAKVEKNPTNIQHIMVREFIAKPKNKPRAFPTRLQLIGEPLEASMLVTKRARFLILLAAGV
jgi:hypothetical protein